MAVFTAPARISVPNNNDECVKRQPQREWPLEAHGQSADQIFQVMLADRVGNNHHRENRNQRSEEWP